MFWNSRRAGSCWCLCKGNQFFANHNYHKDRACVTIAVDVSAKVINFLLITTRPWYYHHRKCCWCLCKGNQFFANHNGQFEHPTGFLAVDVSAKVINFLLITTQCLLLSVNSCCWCLCKGNQFFANHNISGIWPYMMQLLMSLQR